MATGSDSCRLQRCLCIEIDVRFEDAFRLDAVGVETNLEQTLVGLGLSCVWCSIALRTVALFRAWTLCVPLEQGDHSAWSGDDHLTGDEVMV